LGCNIEVNLIHIIGGIFLTLVGFWLDVKKW